MWISECHKVSNSVTAVENSHFCQKLLDLFIFYLKKVNFPKDRTCKILSGCGKTIICQQLTLKKANSFQDFQDPRKACILKLFATFPHFPQTLIIIILLNIYLYIFISEKKNLEKRQWQDLNLRIQRIIDFKSIALDHSATLS